MDLNGAETREESFKDPGKWAMPEGGPEDFQSVDPMTIRYHVLSTFLQRGAVRRSWWKRIVAN